MEIMITILGITNIVTLCWNIYLASDNIKLRSERKQFRQELEFKDKVIGWRNESITELLKSNNAKENELNWYRNATNSESKGRP